MARPIRASILSRRQLLGTSAALLMPPRLVRADIVHLKNLVPDGGPVGMVAGVLRDGERQVLPFGRMRHDGADMTVDTQFRVASITKLVTALAAMMLVDDGVLTLDGSVNEWLPELADRQVLRAIEGQIDDTIPAERTVSLRDLLTCRFGLGAIMNFPPDWPIQRVMADVGIAPGYLLPQMSADNYMQRLGSLPLAAQPGSKFLYNNGLDVAGILISRASGQSLSDFLKTRIFAPLGMNDTGFQGDQARLATIYGPDGATDGPEMGFTGPPPMESGAGGLVSTVPDFLLLMAMMLDRGSVDGQNLITPDSFDAMISDNLTKVQRTDPNAAVILGESQGWGLGMATVYDGGPLGLSAGSFGWVGGYGTCAYADPARRLVGVLMTGAALTSPEPPDYMIEFWRHVNV